MEITPQKDYHAPMHTAEHILNQTMVRMFDCGRSFSNHIERKKSKCDYHFDRSLSDEEISLIENRVNETIGRSLEVSDEILPFEEAKQQYNLANVPENNGTKIRIVHIGDYDSCPCIGKHVSNTNEIGRFKITTSNFDNGVLRIRYKLLSD